MARGTRIGVDIGATAVRAAELSMRGTPPSLVRAAQVPLEPGAVAGGEIRNPEAVADIRTTFIIGIGLAEACAIYAFVVALILLFV